MIAYKLSPQHPFKETIEEYLAEVDCFYQASIQNGGNCVQYSFCIGQTTSVIKLESYEENGFLYQWIGLEFSIGCIDQKESDKILSKICQELYWCNYPFRVLIPDQNSQLMILNFRSDVNLLRDDAINGLIQSGFSLAEHIRDQHKICSVFRSL